MKYRQLDRIVSLVPGTRLVGERTLGADEDYLRDHFPRLPVMPGVMMLEALHQASLWMIRSGDNFTSPLVVLREARNVKFGDFLSPGQTLTIKAEWIKEQDGLITVKASGQKDGRVTVSARLILERCRSNEPPELGIDADVSMRSRKQFIDLFGEAPLSGETTS